MNKEQKQFEKKLFKLIDKVFKNKKKDDAYLLVTLIVIEFRKIIEQWKKKQ